MLDTPPAAVLGLDDDPLLAPADVAELLGVTDRTLRNWAAADTGPKRLRVGRKHVRYRASDVRRWLNEGCAA